MNRTRALVLTASILGLGGAASALQQQSDHSRELMAESSLYIGDDEDEISVSYRAIRQGPKTIAAMTADPQVRQRVAQRIRERLAATLSTDVILTYQTQASRYPLQPGEYELMPVMNDELGWDLVILVDGRPRGKVALTMEKAREPAPFLTMHLVPLEGDRVRLEIAFGDLYGYVDAGYEVAADDDDADDMDDMDDDEDDG